MPQKDTRNSVRKFRLGAERPQEFALATHGAFALENRIEVGAGFFRQMV